MKYVEKSLDVLDEGILNMRHIAMGAGVIELGFLRTLGVGFLPEMAHRFLEEQKEKTIQFKFHTGITASLLEGLKDEKYDIVFCTKRENEPDIHFIPVSKQDLVVIAPKNHPLSGHESINLKELAPYPQIYFSQASGLRGIVDNLFQKIQVKPQIAYEIDEDIVIAGFVSKGFGVAVVPYMTDLLRMDVKIIQISYPDWERKFYMVASENTPYDTCRKELLRLCHNKLRHPLRNVRTHEKGCVTFFTPFFVLLFYNSNHILHACKMVLFHISRNAIHNLHGHIRIVEIRSSHGYCTRPD